MWYRLILMSNLNLNDSVIYFSDTSITFLNDTVI